jgi:hypothetical protein
MCVVWQASGKTEIIKSVISSLPENKIFGHFLCRVRAYLFTEAPFFNTSTGGLTDLSKNKYTPSNTSTEHLLLRLLLSFDVGCGLCCRSYCIQQEGEHQVHGNVKERVDADLV